MGGDGEVGMGRAIVRGFGLQLVEALQRPCELARVGDRAQGEVVGDLLALDAQPPRQPPHDRVVEQQGFDRALQQVDQVVVTPHMREFVCEQGFEQVRGHAGEERGGHQHHRAPPARDGRPFEAFHEAKRRRIREANGGRNAFQSRLPGEPGGLSAAAQATDPGQAQCEAQGQQRRTERPDRNQPRQVGLYRDAPVGAARSACVEQDR